MLVNQDMCIVASLERHSKLEQTMFHRNKQKWKAVLFYSWSALHHPFLNDWSPVTHPSWPRSDFFSHINLFFLTLQLTVLNFIRKTFPLSLPSSFPSSPSLFLSLSLFASLSLSSFSLSLPSYNSPLVYLIYLLSFGSNF